MNIYGNFNVVDPISVCPGRNIFYLETQTTNAEESKIVRKEALIHSLGTGSDCVKGQSFVSSSMFLYQEITACGCPGFIAPTTQWRAAFLTSEHYSQAGILAARYFQ